MSASATRRDACAADPFPRVVTALLAAALVLRLIYIFTYRIDTDEPQHLHVIWSWVRGLVQYRDTFDNHAPLFHLAFAPVAAAVGERPDILLWMRLATVPVSALTLWSAYAIGRATWGEAVGAWAAVLAALVPAFFLTSVEFRADTLWAALWVLAIATLVTRPFTRARSFAAGLLLGATLCTSLKSVLLLAALGAAIVATLLRSRARAVARRRTHWAAAALGITVVPLALGVWFWWHRALLPMLQAAITHNLKGGLALEMHLPLKLVALAAILPSWWWLGARVQDGTEDPGLGARRGIVVLTAVGYLGLLECCWPVATRQDYAPWVPLVAIPLTALGSTLLAHAGAWTRLGPGNVRNAVATVIAVGEGISLLAGAPPWHARIRVDPALLADVLRLTDPSDPVMDLKGETVFRERPFYYALETLTRLGMRDGTIADTIPERLRATRTCVAVQDNERFPPRAREFLARNYVSVGRLRVAGRLLTDSACPSRCSLPFEVAIPATYAIVVDGHDARGWLDGHRYEGPEFLAAGRHRFRAAPTDGAIALVWAPAIARGFSPFAAPGRT